MPVKKVAKAQTCLFYNLSSPGEVGSRSKVEFGFKTAKESFNLEKSYFLEIPEIESEIKRLEKYIHEKYDMDMEHGEIIENKIGEIGTVVRNTFLQEYSNKLIRLIKSGQKVDDDSVYTIYKNNVYKLDRGDYTDEEMLLQIMDLEDNERKRFEHLKHRFKDSKEECQEKGRQAIPEEVRIVVWRRDGGKCAKCGSRENLEYDHIIPISKGGSNTVRNIELLCEKCNRVKHDNIQ